MIDEYKTAFGKIYSASGYASVEISGSGFKIVCPDILDKRAFNEFQQCLEYAKEEYEYFLKTGQWLPNE